MESFVEIGWQMSDLGRKNWFSGFLDPQNDVIMRFGGSKNFFIKKFRPKYGGMQNLRKIVRAVLAPTKNTWFVYISEKPPLWHFLIRLIMQEEKVFRNFISFSLRSKEMLASLARNFSLLFLPYCSFIYFIYFLLFLYIHKNITYVYITYFIYLLLCYSIIIYV